MRNTLTDLNNALFAELESLQDESDGIEQLEHKLNRAGAVAKIAETIVKNAELSFKVMQHMNDACKIWKARHNIDFSLYGTPLESTTYKFAKCLQKRFGVIPGVTDRMYITNSYHVHVTEKIDAFKKLSLESKFQRLSPGGAISYIEVPDMQNNIDAVMDVMKFIYENIMYAELNTKSDYCQVCGFDGEIEIRQYTDDELMELYSPKEIVQNAKHCLGYTNYNLIFNNCEHFANSCTTGKHRSPQVEELFASAVLLLK